MFACPCSVRRLLLDMHEDVCAWLKFASLCRKSGRTSQVGCWAAAGVHVVQLHARLTPRC